MKSRESVLLSKSYKQNLVAKHQLTGISSNFQIQVKLSMDRVLILMLSKQCQLPSETITNALTPLLFKNRLPSFKIQNWKKNICIISNKRSRYMFLKRKEERLNENYKNHKHLCQNSVQSLSQSKSVKKKTHQ